MRTIAERRRPVTKDLEKCSRLAFRRNILARAVDFGARVTFDFICLGGANDDADAGTIPNSAIAR